VVLAVLAGFVGCSGDDDSSAKQPGQPGQPDAGARPAGAEPYNILHLVDDVVAMADELGADRYHVFTGIGIPQEQAAAYAEVLGTPEALGAGLNWYRANPLPTDARIGPVKVPTLYVWGDEDIAFARSTAEATASYVEPATYTFRELTGRGHWLPEEAPAEIAAALVEHLDAVS
jgi:pimeloyl-ACP methyl ester carboxylesterase